MTGNALAPTDLAAKKRAVFIDALRECGSVKHAATVAGLRSNHLYEDRKINPDLAEAWDAALEEFAGKLHAELIAAALGTSKIYTKPDPRFLIEANKAHNPEYFREKREYTTIVNVGQDYESHIPAPARPPVIDAESRPVSRPELPGSTESNDRS